MKRSFLLSLGLMGCMAAMAQTPRWVVAPQLDSLSVIVDNSVIRADSAGVTTLYSMNGTRLFSTSDDLHPYTPDSVATITAKGTDSIVGFVDRSGRFTPLQGLKVAYGNPNFENGYLTAISEEGVGYYKTDGEKAQMDFWAMRSFPYSQGYAPYFMYNDLERLKDPHYGYYDRDGKAAAFNIVSKGETKHQRTRDLRFLSALGENGKAVAIIKGKLYMLDGSTMTFEPILHGDTILAEKKRMLSLKGGTDRYTMEFPKNGFEIHARYGQDSEAVVKIDGALRPVSIDFGDELMTFASEAPDSVAPSAPTSYATSLVAFTDGGKTGLCMAADSSVVLPAQFDAVDLLYGQRAFVRSGSKWGILEIAPGQPYSVKVNDGKCVAFRHSVCPTTLEIDFPAGTTAAEYTVALPDSTSGYKIDPSSLVTTDSSMVYNCILAMPAGLSDSITPLSLAPSSVTCNGLQLAPCPLCLNASYEDHFNVELHDSATMKGADAVFELSIDPQLAEGETTGAYSVSIVSEKVPVLYGKMADNLYKCMINALPEGVTSFKVMVTEEGCPASAYPLEVTYVKADSANNVAEQLTVTRPTPVVAPAAAASEPEIQFMQSTTSSGQITAEAIKPAEPVMAVSTTSTGQETAAATSAAKESAAAAEDTVDAASSVTTADVPAVQLTASAEK